MRIEERDKVNDHLVPFLYTRKKFPLLLVSLLTKKFVEYKSKKWFELRVGWVKERPFLSIYT